MTSDIYFLKTSPTFLKVRYRKLTKQLNFETAMSSQNDKECHRPYFLQLENKKVLPYLTLLWHIERLNLFTLQQPQRSSLEPHRVGGRQLVAASASFTTPMSTTVGRLFMTNDMAVTKKGIFAVLGRIIKTFITFYRKIT